MRQVGESEELLDWHEREGIGEIDAVGDGVVAGNLEAGRAAKQAAPTSVMGAPASETADKVSGLKREQSAVSLFAAEPPRGVSEHTAPAASA